MNVRLEWEGRLAVLTLQNPAKRNALSLACLREMIVALDEASVGGVVVIAAEGPAFCAGHDLTELRTCTEEEAREIFTVCMALMAKIHAMRQPVIAQVHGAATAAGCQLVAACDLAVAAEEAWFSTPGVNIGLFCSTPMVEVARAVGRKRAFEMLLTGRRVDARTAAEWGLINRVVPQSELAGAVRELAEQILRSSEHTVATGKYGFYRQADQTMQQAYGMATEMMVEGVQDAEAREGISAFLEKREPVWPDR